MYLKSILVLVGIFLFSCSSPKEEKSEEKQSKKITNPNGMSEMSLIMEDWYSSMVNISTALNSGNKAKNIPDAEAKDIYKAKTSKENIHSKKFDGFVHGFFYNYSQISKASSLNEQIDEFNLTVKSCLNCHEQYCHGPIVRIQKLLIKVE